MMIHFTIGKNEIEHIKFRMRKKLEEGMSTKAVVTYGVKQISKIADKQLVKHKQMLLKRATLEFIKAFAIDKEQDKDPMAVLNEQYARIVS